MARKDILVLIEEGRQQQDDDEGGEYICPSCQQGHTYPAELVADVPRHIYGEDPRGGLGYGEDVEELLLAEPACLIDDLTLHHRDHGIAAADGGDPDLEENAEELSLLLACHWVG